MKRQHVFFIVGALVIGLLGGYGFALLLQKNGHGQSSVVAADASDSGGRKVLYWHDPMKPDVKFDKPGKSPFMDMQLVPVYADENATSQVQIDPKIVQSLGIRTARVERRSITQSFNATGIVAFDQRHIEVVQARVAGTVTKAFVKSAFEPVRKGQPLFQVLSPDWVSAQQEYLALLDSQGATAQSIRDAARARLHVLGVPDATIQDIERTRKTSVETTVFAPQSGVIAELMVREGSAFEAGASLAQINSLDTIWVDAQIPESQIANIPIGSSVHVRSTSWPGASFEGKVIAQLPNVDTQTRTLTVRIEVHNNDHKLSPGMFVAVELGDLKNGPQLVIPTEAIITTGERSVVILAREGGGFDVANVTPGVEAGGLTTILSGLKEDDSVVLSGQFLIDSEASLRSTVDRLTSEKQGEAAAPAKSVDDEASQPHHVYESNTAKEQP
jgi:Cu(I)/Ag(I) efflux system membrane fusion protein